MMPVTCEVSFVAGKGVKPAAEIHRDYSLPDKTPLVVEVTEAGQFLEIKVPKPAGNRPR